MTLQNKMYQCDKIQKWYGCQRYYSASKRYITVLPLVRYPLWLTAMNRCYYRGSNGSIFLPLYLGRYMLSDMELFMVPYYFWILSWFTDISEVSESHFWKTQLYYISEKIVTKPQFSLSAMKSNQNNVFAWYIWYYVISAKTTFSVWYCCMISSIT